MNKADKITVSRIIVRSKKKSFRSMPDNPELYRFVDSYTAFDYIDYGAQDEFPLSLRVVRVKIPDGGYENLITNLPPEEFDLFELCDLYHLRWKIENSFRELKHVIGSQDFGCRIFEYVIHEVWARLILYNFCSRITALALIEKLVLSIFTKSIIQWQ